MMALPAYAGDEYFPFEQNPQSTLEKAFDPRNIDVSMIINNLPYYKKLTEEQIDLEKKLLQVVQAAKQKNSVYSIQLYPGFEDCPPDIHKKAQLIIGDPLLSLNIVGGKCYWYYRLPNVQNNSEHICKALELLAFIYYRQEKYDEAINKLKDSLDIKLAQFGPDDLRIAQIYDFIAQIARAAHSQCRYYLCSHPKLPPQKNWDVLAEAYYKLSSDIKQKNYGTIHKKIASSYMNLACLYHDRGKNQKAESNEFKAKEITDALGEKVFISATITPQSPRPIPTSINCAYYNEWSNIEWETESIINYYKAIDAYREAVIKSVTADLKKILTKLCEQPKLAIPPGIANIVGTVQVALDRTDSRLITKTLSETETKSEVSTTNRTDKAVDLENFEICLCTSDVSDAIDRTIEAIGKANYISDPLSTLGKNWPGIREQALELLVAMGDTAIKHKVRLVETNSLGEYQIKDVPKGKYVLYAQLVTKKEAIYWQIPITIDQPDSIRIDFLNDNVKTILWQKNKQTPITTPKSQTKLERTIEYICPGFLH
jgi:tetratricopeptide (TPR) repeat protein